MKTAPIPSLTNLLTKLLRETTRENPVHWSVLVEKFVDSGQWTNAELVGAMNSLLVPSGSVRGSNNNFWIEPLS